MTGPANIFTRRLADETPREVTLPEPEQHLWWICQEVVQSFLAGDRDTGVRNLAHAVHVAATKPTSLSGHELTRLVNDVVDAWAGIDGEAA